MWTKAESPPSPSPSASAPCVGHPVSVLHPAESDTLPCVIPEVEEEEEEESGTSPHEQHDTQTHVHKPRGGLKKKKWAGTCAPASVVEPRH